MFKMSLKRKEDFENTDDDYEDIDWLFNDYDTSDYNTDNFSFIIPFFCIIYILSLIHI